MRIHSFNSFINENSTLEREYRRKEMLRNLIDDRDQLKDDVKDAYSDMENDPDIEAEGGPVANKWGDKINKMEQELEKLNAKIDKMENPVKREAKQQSDAKKKITKNLEDIKASNRSWPDRTVQQQAEIFKKRYAITDDLETIVKVLTDLKTEKKL